MAREYTPEQLAAINTTDRTILLSAAAGSGKTATLTERLIRMITDPEKPLDVTRMLIVTFTRAAAKELRERISAALSAAIEKDPANKRLARQMLLLPSAKIRTIDAFCNDLVRGHTDALGITPLYRIPDEAEAALLALEVMDDLIEEVYRGDYRAEGLDVFLLAESLVSVKQEKALGEKLLKFYTDSVVSYIDGEGLLREAAEDLAKGASLAFFDTAIGRAFLENTVEELAARAAILRTLSAEARETETEKEAEALSLSAEGMSLYLEGLAAAAREGYAAFHTALSLPPPKATAVSDSKLTEAGRACKAFRSDSLGFRKGLFESLERWDEESIGRLFAETHRVALSLSLLLSEFSRRFADAKRERGLCEYSDLSHFAYRLLVDEKGEKTPLAHELTAAFDVVSIDEYQDVNEIQHKIFEAISSPTNRFMVGDIKQSIYGFRGAEPSIFAALRATFPTLTEKSDRAVLFLTRNFRSADRILSFANGVFDFLFGTVGDSIGYAEEDRLRPPERKAGDTPLDTPTPTLFLLPDEGEEEDAPDEMAFVAKQIRLLLSSGRRADGSPVKPSDIAVLTRSNRSKRSALLALRAADVPSFYEEEEDFFAHSEVLLALCLLNAVNNPRRDIYLAGLLRSPLYRFTMEELVRIKRRGGATLYDALTRYAEEEDFEKGRAFLSELAAFRAKAEGERADRLLRYLFDKTAIMAAVDEEGQDRLYRLYELARGRESLSFHGVYSFISYINDLMAAGKGSGGKTGKGNEAEGVYVDTVHGTKGLEFPICFLTGCGARLSYDPPDRLPVNYIKGLGFASPVASHDGLGVVSSPLYRILGAVRKRRELEEEVRVLYVALTRPKEQLFITAALSGSAEDFLSNAKLLRRFPSAFMLSAKRNYAAWIAAALGDDPDRLTVKSLSSEPLSEVTEEGIAPHAAAQAEEATAPVADEEKVKEAYDLFEERFSFVYPHTAEASLPGKLSVSRLYPGFLDESEGEGAPLSEEERQALLDDSRADRAPLAPFYLSGIETDAAAKAGTATHLFLQFCDFSDILTTDGCHCEKIEQELARLTRLGFLDSADSARVRQKELADFAVSPLAEEIRRARALHRELRFNTLLPATLLATEQREKYEGLEIFVQGVIDLLIEREDGSLLLVDYKTDRLPREALTDKRKARDFLFGRHASQLTYYAEAAKRIFGKTPTLAIYSLHAGALLLLDEESEEGRAL